MREQNWTLGSRYVIPTNELLKSGKAIFNVTDFHEILVKGGDIKLAETIELINIPSEVINKVSIDLNNNSVVGGIFAESGGSVVEGTSDSYAFWLLRWFCRYGHSKNYGCNYGNSCFNFSFIYCSFIRPCNPKCNYCVSNY